MAYQAVSTEFPCNGSVEWSPDPVATLHEPRLVLDFTYQVKLGNRSFYRTFQAEPGAVGQRTVSDLGNGRMQTMGKYRLGICALPSVAEGK